MTHGIQDLWLVGIGTGSPAHITFEGAQALRDAAVILLPLKGCDKTELAALRRDILGAVGSQAQIVTFDYPRRDPDLPYQDRVIAWHDEICARWVSALKDQLGGETPCGPVALLVWGDPSLYDSTIRIAARLDPAPRLRVVPGITAVQALTAAHGIALNTVNGPIQITTGRQLRDHGWPEGQETVVVMLDADCRFADLDPVGIHIWWGAYLGADAQLLIAGPLEQVRDRIIEKRAAARARHGWIMDTYLMRRT